jgi:pyruvate/2-oxoglutarate dehydrogenase complex dihydrolipoamide dehydrogenase (E3) component
MGFIMQEQNHDIVVVGSGPSGRIVSLRLAKHGFSVALVEPELVGADCHYWASVLRRQPLK